MNWFGVGGRFDGCVYRDNEWKWVDENHCIVAPNKPTCGSQRGQLSWRPPGGRFSKGKMTTPRREFFVSLFRFSTHVRLGFFFRARPVSQTDVSRVFFGRPTFYGNRRRKRQFGPTRWTVAKHGSRSLKKFPPKSSKEHSGKDKKKRKTKQTKQPRRFFLFDSSVQCCFRIFPRSTLSAWVWAQSYRSSRCFSFLFFVFQRNIEFIWASFSPVLSAWCIRDLFSTLLCAVMALIYWGSCGSFCVHEPVPFSPQTLLGLSVEMSHFFSTRSSYLGSEVDSVPGK